MMMTICLSPDNLHSLRTMWPVMNIYLLVASHDEPIAIHENISPSSNELKNLRCFPFWAVMLRYFL